MHHRTQGRRWARIAWISEALVCFASAQLGLGALPNSTGTSAARPASNQNWPRFTLKAEKTWQLNPPGGRTFEASGLLRTRERELLTIDNTRPQLHRIVFRAEASAADLIAVTNLFTSSQLAPLRSENLGLFDCEGIAQDAQGRIYLCEEGKRWVLRADPKSKTVERLKIDWAPVRKYFHPIDRNASFEGIAIGHGKLYVANERQRGRIIAVDLESLAVLDEFAVRPRGSNARDVDYSDLSWFEDALFVLLRESRCVLKVDPATHAVLAEYDYREVEGHPDAAYRTLYPTGVMEGLSVDHDSIWLVTDNNGLGRIRAPKDTRPTLFKCLRPDRNRDDDPTDGAAGRKTAK